MRARACFFLLCICCLLLFSGCDVLSGVNLSPGDTPSAAVATHTWTTVAPGVEVRREVWQSPSTANDSDTVSIARFNLQHVSLSVAYQPNQPLAMQQWMQKEQATALINGGFFDAQDNATALVVSQGQSFGTSYPDYGGILAVDAHGKVELRSLHDQPYDPAENLTQATECTPMLLLNGKRTNFNADAHASPRSVVAIDKEGRLLFIASPGLAFTLDDLATLLQKSDLGLVNALNLDGGSSTGLYVSGKQNADQDISIDSFVNLPLVIVVKEK